MPQLSLARSRWRKRVLLLDAIIIGAAVASAGVLLWLFGPLAQWLNNPAGLLSNWFVLSVIAGLILLCLILHFLIRRWAATSIAKTLDAEAIYGNLSAAFSKNTRMWTSVFRSKPVGWSRRISAKLSAIRNDVDQFIQKLNDNFSSPSGKETQ